MWKGRASNTKTTYVEVVLGIVMGNPWVSHRNPYPYPQKPIPTSMGMGFHGYRYGFLWVSWVKKPMEYRLMGFVFKYVIKL